jgi:uncharacterized protein
MFKKLILFFVLLASGYTALAQDFPPKPAALITDYTNTLSPGDEQLLENKLVAFDDSSSTQIAVVVMKSVGDYDIDQYAAALGRKWGIGQKGNNNGLLILVAMDQHKVAIQIGYGLEGAVPDVITHVIIQNDITPRFKQGDYYGGLNAGIDDLIKYSKGEFKAAKKPQHHNDNGSGGAGIIVFIIIIFILIIIFRNRGGSGGQIIGGRGGASPFWWFLAGDILGGAGRGGDGWGGGIGGGGD